MAKEAADLDKKNRNAAREADFRSKNVAQKTEAGESSLADAV